MKSSFWTMDRLIPVPSTWVMETWRAVALFAATLSTGLMAGVFAIYANAVMPGLRRVDDRTFVGAFQAIDTAIINPAFLATFLGAFLSTAAAALLHIGADSSALPWSLAALALYAFVVVSTIAVNVPRNDALKAAGAPDSIPDLEAVRRRFGEQTWARWNFARAVMSTMSFACLAWALLEHGRAT
jgi:uncharacterized membrane protein